GSHGIGLSFCLAHAEEGAAVEENYRSGEAEAADVVRTIEGAGGRAVGLHADVAEYDQVERLVERTIAELGGLHMLVNNAGMAKDALLFNMKPGDWLDVMRVNFGGVFNGTKAALSHFMSE